MKKLISILIALCAFTSFAAAEYNIMTVDVQALYRDYYKTQEALEKIKSSAEIAEEQRQQLFEEGKILVEEFNALKEKAENPALSEEARKGFTAELQEKQQEIREKELEVKQFQQNTQRSLYERQRTHRDLMVDEIKQTVIDIGKEKGADLIFDTSAPESTGIIPSILYARPEWDATKDVLARLNADAPKDDA